MHVNFQLLLGSLGSTAAVAMLAQGLVVVYRGSGVLNFAHGALASASAFTYISLAGPKHEWNKWLVAVLAVLVAVALGVAFQFLVMARLRSAPALAKVVATLGLLVTVTAALPLMFTFEARPPVPLFPAGNFTLPFGEPHFMLPKDRAYLALVAAGLTVVLWIVFRYTRFGRVTRATAENERAVALMGYSPQVIAAANWALGSALAGAAGVLLASFIRQTEMTLTLVLMAAIAAALPARFQSFGITLLASFVLVGGQSLLLRYGADLTNATTISGWADLLPFLVIVAYMVIKGAPIPLRGALVETRLPAVPTAKRPLLKAAIALAVGIAWFTFLGRGWADPMTVTLIFATVCLSLVVLVGFLGQVSLVQMALCGVGAFFASKAASSWGVPFPLPILLGGLLVVPVGVLLALPALRVRGINLAVITVSAAFAFTSSFFTDTRLLGGATFPPAKIAGVSANGVRDPRAFGVVVLVVFLVMALGVSYLRKSELGVRFLAVRANERGAAALGIPVARTKLAGFGIAAFIAGIGGGLFGYRSLTLSYETFAPLQSLLIVAFAYLGGIGSIVGAFIAGFSMSGGVASHLFHFEGNAGLVVQMIGGLGVMMTVALHPDGVALIGRDIRRHRDVSRRAELAGVEQRSDEPVEQIAERPLAAASAGEPR